MQECRENAVQNGLVVVMQVCRFDVFNVEDGGDVVELGDQPG